MTLKRLILFILVFIKVFIYPVYCCGPYYPHGEDIRFSLLTPEALQSVHPEFKPFFYSSSIYYGGYYSFYQEQNESPEKEITDSARKENLDLWLNRCKQVPETDDIYRVIYGGEPVEWNKKSTNSFIRYLSKSKDHAALNYIRFAHECEVFNCFYSDPWERGADVEIPKRTELIQKAQTLMNQTKDTEIRNRYAFLTLRLAYYNNDRETIRKVYNEVVANSESKNIIYYWSTYFYMFAAPEKEKPYYAAQVFLNAPDKQYMLSQHYNDIFKNGSIETSLDMAKNSHEKAAVYFFQAIRNYGKSLDAIKEIYTLQKNFEGLEFLLIREVNKLEDWLLTPYFTSFNSSLLENWWSEDTTTMSLKQKRMQEDKQYAGELLDFIKKTDINQMSNPAVWEMSEAYICYMTGEYESSLAIISRLEKQVPANDPMRTFLNQVEALCLIARQPAGDTSIPEKARTILINQGENAGKFFFAISRELEYRGNTTDAVALLSRINEKKEDWHSEAYWKSPKNIQTLDMDFYYDYFLYIDAHYTIQQVDELIDKIKKSQIQPDSFSEWVFKTVVKDIDRLYDLLGTKYMRADKLHLALEAFENVNDTLWYSDNFPYKTYLNANPFYTNMYNEHTQTEADTITFTKATLTRKLIENMKHAESATRNDRDYYYFLVANCYLNMTQYGNSWMMKRYFWSVNLTATGLEDDEEYYSASLAEKYYMEAKKHTKSKKFAALCLRMAGRCERYRLMRDLSVDDLSWEELENQLFTSNKYYQQINKEYPDYYDDMIYNCYSFENYFNSRK
ncbi:MAG: hypothetical protein LBV74_14445 [Tannerella sp.]|jgi:hypothetical protein|nr:hypothetical protein [Tannerella sp.]